MPRRGAARAGGFEEATVKFDENIVAQKITGDRRHHLAAVNIVPNEGRF